MGCQSAGSTRPWLAGTSVTLHLPAISFKLVIMHVIAAISFQLIYFLGYRKECHPYLMINLTEFNPLMIHHMQFRVWVCIAGIC